eukprot:6377557-Prorocentrum_lima.AAC.1
MWRTAKPQESLEKSVALQTAEKTSGSCKVSPRCQDALRSTFLQSHYYGEYGTLRKKEERLTPDPCEGKVRPIN